MKTLLSWSSGKDSAWSLHVLNAKPEIEVVGLVTTVNQAFDRVAMHGVRRSILQAQAAAAGRPLHVIPLPWPCTNDDYERLMGAFVREQVAAGIEAMAFGDLFLQEIRAYRESKLAGSGLKPLFPLWQRPTHELADEMIDGGLKTVLATVDPAKVPAEFAGRTFDRQLLSDLPAGVDPCGENGEFHTCVFAGPMLSRDLDVRIGERVTRDGFVYADIVLDEAARP